MENITYESATILGTEKGWALPGGFHTCNRAVAEAVAMKMHYIMGRSQ